MSVLMPGSRLSASPFAVLAFLAAALTGVAFGDGPLPGAWLDTQALPNWNAQGGEVPKAAATDGELVNGPCADEIYSPGSAEDKAVADAGWSVFGPPQSRAGTVVVTAAAGVDGMCRPLGLQGFVFLDGKFAGTLAPHPMDARTDGMLGRVQLFGGTLRADFRRYNPSDPLCCPSRTSTVSYRLETGQAGPLLVPGSVDTVRNPTRR